MNNYKWKQPLAQTSRRCRKCHENKEAAWTSLAKEGKKIVTITEMTLYYTYTRWSYVSKAKAVYVIWTLVKKTNPAKEFTQSLKNSKNPANSLDQVFPWSFSSHFSNSLHFWHNGIQEPTSNTLLSLGSNLVQEKPSWSLWWTEKELYLAIRKEQK